MKKILKILFFAAVFICGTVFIVLSLLRSSQSQQQTAQPPDLDRVPARVYGKVEPEGREVFVSSPVTRKVVEIFVSEGERVKKGRPLLSLESDVERNQVEVALARVESLRKALAISQDVLKRRESLFKKDADTEYSSTQARLQVELDQSNLALAEKEVGLAKARLEQLELRSPIDGVLYKFDVRLGETLTFGDASKIILGRPERWVRLSVEAFWSSRVTLGLQAKIYDSETNEFIGTGEVIAQAPYLGRRDFRTEDDQERFDTKYRDVILKLQTDKKDIPLGLSVVAELAPPGPLK